MNNLEVTFFEEYKRLDNLCKDVMQSDQGVTSYIEEMENTSPADRNLVASWVSDYKMLKHVRWIRNDIAHGDGASECKKEDLEFVRSFYKRIMETRDPFGIIYTFQRNSRADGRSVQKNGEKEYWSCSEIIITTVVGIIISFILFLVIISNT